jgi:hypothetical protein
MLYQFKSKTAGDVIMLEANGRKVFASLYALEERLVLGLKTLKRKAKDSSVG